jgi:hypothetical protein
VATEPESVALMAAFGLAAALTPSLLHPAPRSGVAHGFDLLGVTGWIWGWSAIPALLAAGRSTAGPGGTPFSTRALPALPVGRRTRAAAEVVVALLVTFLAWLPLQLVLDRGDLWATLTTMAATALLLAPSLAAWSFPSRSPGVSMARPFAVALALAGSAALGWLHPPLSRLAVSVVLTGLVLAAADREPAWPRLRGASLPSRRVRAGIEPERRLWRDTWEQPLRRFGPWTVAATVVLGIVLVLEHQGRLSALALFVAAELVLVPLLVATLRPLGSELVGMALTGKHGGRRGDFLWAASMLPLRPSTVLRAVWLQALVLMAVVWLSAVLLFAAHAWLEVGRFALIDADGDSLARLLLGYAAIIPCHAGLVLAAAVGDRPRMIVSGTAWLALMHGGPVLLYAAQRWADGDAGASIAVQVVVLGALAGLGGVPPLVHLRRGSPGRELPQ